MFLGLCMEWTSATKSVKFAYTGDGQRHVEILATLQPEAPGSWAHQGHTVVAHGSNEAKSSPSKRKKLKENQMVNKDA